MARARLDDAKKRTWGPTGNPGRWATTRMHNLSTSDVAVLPEQERRDLLTCISTLWVLGPVSPVLPTLFLGLWARDLENRIGMGHVCQGVCLMPCRSHRRAVGREPQVL